MWDENQYVLRREFGKSFGALKPGKDPLARLEEIA
jgi:hypothetical protein